jgi:hypothetical protein
LTYWRSGLLLFGEKKNVNAKTESILISATSAQLLHHRCKRDDCWQLLVSNYPPIVLVPEFANQIFEAIVLPPRPGNPLESMFIFLCRKRCHFVISVYTDKDSAAIRGL